MEEKTKGKFNIKNVMRTIRIVLILGIILGGIGVVQYTRVKEYKYYEMQSETALYTDLTGYRAGADRMFFCSNDGAKAIGRNGTAIWEMSYQLDNPDLAYCNEVAAVADIGGKSVYVVAENGIPHEYQVIYPIVKHEVAGQGVTAVLLDNGMEDFIQLYDINGMLRVDINTKTKVDGIPIDIALSPDGKKLVTLYVTFQGDAMICKATFYNADEVGKNYINNIVAQKTFAENLLAYDVQFISEDTLCVLMENGFSLYKMTEVPELVCEETVKEQAVEFLCVDSGIYAIKENADKQKSLSFYDENGKEREVLKKLPEYESVAATSEEIVFFSPQKVTVYRLNGSCKFSTAFDQSLEAVFPAGSNRYFLVDIGKVQTIKISDRVKNEQ